MRFDETTAFVSVVRAGSFTAAGRVLGVPKSTLSRQIARLEARLGARLLQRTTRSLSLTDTGSAYFERCRHAIEEIEEAERVAQDRSTRASGTLRVSAPFDLARDHLAVLLPEFRARFAEIDLVLLMAQERVDLVGEGFDVALRGGKLQGAGFVSRKLAGSDVQLCASPAYLERRGRPRALADLAEHDGVVMHLREGASWRLQGPGGAIETLPLRPWLVANEWGVLRQAMLDGLGIGPMVVPLVREQLADGSLEIVLPEYAQPGGGLYAIYPSRNHLSPKVRVFVDFVAERLGPRL